MNSLEKEFISYDLALEMKQLGFDEHCFGVFAEGSKSVGFNSEPRNWNDNVINGETTSDPTFSQCFRWFREKYNLNHCIDLNFRNNKYTCQVWHVRECLLNNHSIETYEQAELECLNQLIKIVKDNTDE